MSLFDTDLATKPPVMEPEEPDLFSWTYYEMYPGPVPWRYENPYKPHVKFTNDKKQKQYRKYASRNISWK